VPHPLGRPPTSILLFCGAITSAAANIGLYTVNGGAVVNAALFAAAQSLAAAQNTGLELVHSVTTLANAEKRVWELLGLSADPGLEYDVTLTLTAAATAGRRAEAAGRPPSPTADRPNPRAAPSSRARRPSS
jgi:hypothetical protein